jgi:hypothetical protein
MRHARHAHIQQHDVRVERHRLLYRLAAVRGGADHLDAGLNVQQRCPRE